MELNVLVNGAYQANCYVLSHNKRAILIDPGVDFDLVQNHLKAHKLSLEAVLITHAHFDHCQCAHKFDCKIYISANDFYLAKLSPDIPPFKAHFFENEKIEFEGCECKIIPTSGHTLGSICIELDGKLFTGDTLFKGAVGRTDLPTGNTAALRNSLKKLCKMYADITVLPGHGNPTSINKERPHIEHC